MTLPDKFMPPKLHMQPPSWVVKPTGKAESPKGRHSLNGNNKVARHSTLCQWLSRCLAAFIMPLELQTILTSYQNEMQPTSCLCQKTEDSQTDRLPFLALS